MKTFTQTIILTVMLVTVGNFIGTCFANQMTFWLAILHILTFLLMGSLFAVVNAFNSPPVEDEKDYTDYHNFY